MPHLVIVEVIFMYFNTVNYDYQQDSIIFYTFVLNEPFGQQLDISSKKNFF